MLTTDNLISVITFPFRDEKWKSKLALLVLCLCTSIFVIPAFFMGGYLFELMRNTIRNKGVPSLPDWNKPEEYLLNGLKLFCLSAVCLSPMYLLLFLSMVIIFIPIFFIDSIPPVIFIIATLAYPLLLVSSMAVCAVISLVLNAAIAHAAAEGEFSAVFRIKEWWNIFRKNIGGYLLTYIILIGISMITSYAAQFLMMTIILWIVGMVLMMATSAYGCLVGEVLFAQAYLTGKQRLSTEKNE